MAWLHGILKGTQVAGYDYCGDPKKLIIVDLDGKFKIFYVSQTLCHMVSMVESCSEKKDIWIQVSEKPCFVHETQKFPDKIHHISKKSRLIFRKI